MKCIRCGRDSRRRERSGRLCPGCNRSFAFDPNAGDPVSDARFQACIDAVSAGGALRWGVEHLYYEVNRRRRLKLSKVLVGAIAVGVCALGVTQGLGAFLTAALIGALVLAVVATHRHLSRTVGISREAFNDLWERWIQAHGTPPGVIERKPKEARRARPVEPDVADYSFDRAVICDRARTVDLLLANNFHFENNCAVLSMGGYPEGPFETVLAMLRRNPRLQVFALHDATPAGCRMARRLAEDPRWFKGFGSIIDVGLRPEHAGPFRGLLLPADDACSPNEAVTPEEARWLSQFSLELAAIRPEQVLKRLYRAINRHPEPPARRAPHASGDSGGGGGGSEATVEYDGSSFSTEAGDSEGAADGFG